MTRACAVVQSRKKNEKRGVDKLAGSQLAQSMNAASGGCRETRNSSSTVNLGFIAMNWSFFIFKFRIPTQWEDRHQLGRDSRPIVQDTGSPWLFSSTAPPLFRASVCPRVGRSDPVHRSLSWS